MRESWAGVRLIGGLLVIVLFISGFGFVAWKSADNFRKDCVAVGGRTLTDTDGDLECYRNGIEIAEHGESKPR